MFFFLNAKSAKMSNLTKKCYQIKSAKKDQKDTKSDKKNTKQDEDS